MQDNHVELSGAGWAPLFSSLLDSSVWRGEQSTKEVKLVWVAMLAKKNKRGYVDASLPGLANLAGVSLEECEAALKVLEDPDPYSRNKAHEGRRIKSVENGGWIVLNHAYYRDKTMSAERREYLRRKQAEHRARKQSHEGQFTDPPH